MKRISLFLSLLLALSACGPLPPAPTVTPTPTNTPTATITPSPTATFTPTATPTPSPPETFAAAPETITVTLPPGEEGGPAREVGLNKGNLSAVFDNLVIYRDADGNAQMVLVLGTGEIKDLRDAGIVELDLTDGGKLEVAFFDNKDKAFEYAVGNSVWHFENIKDFGDKIIQGGNELREIYDRQLETIKKMKAFREWGTTLFSPWPKGLGPGEFPKGDRKFIFMGVDYMEEGVLIAFMDKRNNGEFSFILLDNPDETEDAFEIADEIDEIDWLNLTPPDE